MVETTPRSPCSGEGGPRVSGVGRGATLRRRRTRPSGTDIRSADTSEAGGFRTGARHDALRPRRSEPVPPRGRGRLDHPRGRAGQSRAGRRLDPHPGDGGFARRRPADPRAPGREPDPGRAHPADPCPRVAGADRADAGRPVRVRRRGGGADPGALEHQRADRIPARGALGLSGAPHRRQRRYRGADSDEIVGMVADGAADLGIVAGTVDTGRLQTFPFRHDRFVAVVAPGHRSRPKRPSPSPRCWNTTSSASTGRARSPASSPTRPPGSADRCGCGYSCAASTRSAASSSAGSASASCRRRRRGGRGGLWTSPSCPCATLGRPRPDAVPARPRRAPALRAGIRDASARGGGVRLSSRRPYRSAI